MQTRSKPATKKPGWSPKDRKDSLGLIREVQIREATAEEIAAGFCGIVQGVALPYGVRDAYDTVFAAGCLDRTRNKVGVRKVKLFADHNYGQHSHIGTVLELTDAANAAVMTAGLFDTEEGRKAKEYLSAVLKSDSETGLSVGFYDRKSEMQDLEGDRVLVFLEIELEEISLTPRQAVPGATVTGVRQEGEDGVATAERCLRALLEGLPKERALAIVAEVLGVRTDDPPAVTAPAGAQPDPGSRTAHASAEEQDTPIEERRRILDAALSHS